MTPSDFKKLQEKFPIGPGVTKLNLSNNDNTKTGTGLPAAKPQRDQATALESAIPREEKSMGRPTARFVFHRQRLLDRDNAWAGAKDLLDGLRAAGLVSDDTEAAIELKVEQVKVAHRADQKTVVEIIYP
jgi:hypothetical protein